MLLLSFKQTHTELPCSGILIFEDFKDFKNASSTFSPKHATSPVEDISTPKTGSDSNNLWNENSKLVLSRTYDSRIDLIFLLYKSFELGISNKTIIKKNLSVLIFSVSKAQKDFRYDVLQEIKKKKIL